MRQLTAHERVALLAGSFDEQDPGLTGGDPLGFDGYPDALERARAETGLAEAVIWGWADVDGVGCALVVGDFRFLGGSMGTAVGEKVARAFDAARDRRLCVVAVTASGGARMQEGMAALVQMAKTADARRRHAEAGLGLLTLLTSPTTGGVYASFASLADVIFAEPGAHVGFAGPRVVEVLTGRKPPPEMHTAEFAFDHGLVDAIVPRDDQHAIIGRALRGLVPNSPLLGSIRRNIRPQSTPTRGFGAWERVAIARAPERPKAGRILDALLDDELELRSGADPAIIVRLGSLDGTRIVAIAQDPAHHITPGAFRKAQRAIAIAGRIGLPLVSFIGTAGADPGPSSEAEGVAAAIAETFVAMLGCPAPTIAVVTGEGGSGGALSLAVADRVLCWENAFFSVIAPEAAAAILYRDGSRGPELAERLGITSGDLVRLGVVDEVVPEPPGGAQADPEAALRALGARVGASLASLRDEAGAERLARRAERWRRPKDAIYRV